MRHYSKNLFTEFFHVGERKSRGRNRFTNDHHDLSGLYVCPSRRHDLACIQYDDRQDRFLGFNGDPESSVIKLLKGFFRPVLCSFGEDQNRDAHAQDTFQVFDALAAALVAAAVYHHAHYLRDPAKHGDLQQLFFRQCPELSLDGDDQGGDVHIRSVVADEDIRLASFDPFAVADLVRNEIQYAINAGPAFDEKVSDDNRACSENRWDEETGKEKDHKSGEHQKDPGDIDFAYKRFQK